MTINKQIILFFLLRMSLRPNIDKFRFMFSYFEQYCMCAMMIANVSVMKVKLNKRAIK